LADTNTGISSASTLRNLFTGIGLPRTSNALNCSVTVVRVLAEVTGS